MASRFYVPPEQITRHRFILLGSEAHHAAVVLRKQPGDLIDLFDGKDSSFQGRIEAVSPARIEGSLVRESKGTSPSVELVLCQALIKGPKWDWLLEKACEIGVSKIVPLLTARTVVKPSRGAVSERWKRIVLAASKQSGRSRVTEIAVPQTLAEALQSVPKNARSLIPWEKEINHTIHDIFVGHPSPPPSPLGEGRGSKGEGSTQIFLFIGPEGGWETGEVELAVRYGAFPVRLGPTLLRSETAGIVSSALVLAELGVY